MCKLLLHLSGMCGTEVVRSAAIQENEEFMNYDIFSCTHTSYNKMQKVNMEMYWSFVSASCIHSNLQISQITAIILRVWHNVLTIGMNVAPLNLWIKGLIRVAVR